jgi:hypothetical protein
MRNHEKEFSEQVSLQQKLFSRAKEIPESQSRFG